MLSPSANPFGSSAWFDQLPFALPVPERPRFVVEHRVQSHSGEVWVHQQVFDEQRLVAWVPGQVIPDANLILMRDCSTDSGDLLGRIPATEVALSTSLLVASKETDLFGAASVTRPGLDEHTVDFVDIGIVALNTPFGDVDAAIRLNPDGTQEIFQKQEADSQITICAEWLDLLDWMHADFRMGHLLGKNRVQIEGSLTVTSYAEGHVSWPKSPQDQEWSTKFRNTMRAYAQYRLSTEYVAVMDRIEEVTV